MSAKPNKAADFLKAMRQGELDEESAAAPPPRLTEAPAVLHAVPAARPAARAKPTKPPSRAGLKHFGGYLDDETLEKIALLRIRLKRDNSELIKLAIEDLYSRHNAKRAFGDA